jgi:hypothetical protein
VGPCEGLRTANPPTQNRTFLMSNRFAIATGAFLFAVVGFLLYRLQGPSAEHQVMNLWGVVSFGCVGASFACLMVDRCDAPPGPFDRWF